jgi:hypothetical protein
MRCDRRRVRVKEHWFDEECGEKRKQMRVALRKFRDKDDDISRSEYWAKRKEYERLVGEKRGTWQEKEAEYINKLVYGKDIKEIWKAIRKIVKRKEPIAFVEPNEWVRHFQGLFSGGSSRGLTEVYETQRLGPLYIEELDRDFTKGEVKELTVRMKNNKASGWDGMGFQFSFGRFYATGNKESKF